MPIMEIAIVPIGTKTPSVSKYIASSIKVLNEEKGIKYNLTSMGTIIEADSVKKLLNIAGKMHRKVLSGKVKRVVTAIKIDERKDKKLTAKRKIQSVRNKLKNEPISLI